MANVAVPELIHRLAEADRQVKDAGKAAAARVKKAEAKLAALEAREKEERAAHEVAMKAMDVATARRIKDIEAKAVKAVKAVQDKTDVLEERRRKAEEISSKADYDAIAARDAATALQQDTDTKVKSANDLTFKTLDDGYANAKAIREAGKSTVHGVRGQLREERSTHVGTVERIFNDAKSSIMASDDRADSSSKYKSLCGLARLRDKIIEHHPNATSTSPDSKELMKSIVEDWVQSQKGQVPRNPELVALSA
eukprot:gnl/MRDRNA2_/MRDRNA2_29352_c0_seq1.p1 gnl/MRDRNA2_/MRDRNA2_29352_c0~~gnl/MRDRNA2_/MRDRNA2_29352_c0_seq1.p1  ORF type:complete len:280 (+),score=88.18 gnl/MRDRNA2_/MRDRNA2_29352_c0_seq1:84-842(+)